MSADVLYRIDVQTGESLTSVRDLHSRFDELIDKLEAAKPAAEQAGDAVDDIGPKAKKAATGLDGVNTYLKSADSHLSTATSGFLHLGASMLGPIAIATTASMAWGKLTGAVSDFTVASLHAAVEAEDSENRLASALKAVRAEAAFPELVTLAGELQTFTRYSDDAIMSAQGIAVRIGGAAAATPEFTRAVVDLAAALKVDLETAGEALAKTFTGNTTALRRFGVDLGDVTEDALRSGEAVRIVGERFAGAAVEDTTKLGGALDQLDNSWEEVQESFGRGLSDSMDLPSKINAITGVVTLLDDAAGSAGNTIGSLATGMDDLAVAMTEGLAVIPGLGPALSAMAAGVGLGGEAGEGIGGGLKAYLELRAQAQSIVDGFQSSGGTGGSAPPPADHSSAVAEAERLIAQNRTLAQALKAVKLDEEDLNEIELARLESAVETTRAREQAEKAAAADAKRLAEQIDALHRIDDLTLNKSLMAQSMLTDQDELLKLYDAELSKIESSRAAAFDLAAALKLSPEELDDLNAELDAAAEQINAIASENHLAKAMADAQTKAASVADILVGLSDAQLAANRGDTEMEGFEDGGAVTTETMTESEIAQQRALIDGEHELFELRQQLAEQGMTGAQIEDALTEARLQAAAANDSIATASERAAAKLELQIRANERAASSFKPATAAMNLMGQAGGNLAAGLMQMAITGEGSFKKLLHAELTSLATSSASKVIFEIAEAYAAAARYDPVSAANHSAAASFYAMVALAAGAGAALTGGGGGGSGGGSPGSNESLNAANPRTQQQLAAEQAQGPQQQVHVNITGGYWMENRGAVAREITGMVQHAIEESGGRTSTNRYGAP